TINSIKQAGEFGITEGGQALAGLLVFSSDVHSLGTKVAQGLVLTEPFRRRPVAPVAIRPQAARLPVRRADSCEVPQSRHAAP
ncbi:hypothetical protein MKK69_19975, partial [Methylobacterium sp. J-026]|uniref:ABC transporter substrate-binding protein n=1 Tax=Methylobacterium sp. J-026 TaxID=2836624 RepID=UPI003918F33B|nr:hypothetical protein [Methylobacterium sp. J-026]